MCFLLLFSCVTGVSGSDVTLLLFFISHPPLCLIMNRSQTMICGAPVTISSNIQGPLFATDTQNLYSWFNYSPLSVICPPLTPPRSQSNISHARPHRYLCKGTSGHFERITKSIVYKRPPVTFFRDTAAILESNQSHKYRQSRTVDRMYLFLPLPD